MWSMKKVRKTDCSPAPDIATWSSLEVFSGSFVLFSQAFARTAPSGQWMPWCQLALLRHNGIAKGLLLPKKGSHWTNATPTKGCRGPDWRSDLLSDQFIDADRSQIDLGISFWESAGETSCASQHSLVQSGHVRVMCVTQSRQEEERWWKEFPLCILSARSACCFQRETRRVEWKKWTSFNADVVLTDEEVRQLTDAGCEIYPMQWVDTDKKRTSAKGQRLCFCSHKVWESTGWIRKLRENGGTSHRFSSRWRGFAHFFLQLVCTSSFFHPLVWFHERTLSRTRNRSNLVVPYPSWRYSGRRSCRWSNLGFTCSCLRCNGCRTRIVASIEEHVQIHDSQLVRTAQQRTTLACFRQRQEEKISTCDRVIAWTDASSWSPSVRENVQSPVFVFLAELALQSDDHIETCDIFGKHLCRCYVLKEHHKIVSMLQRHFDVRVVTTQSQDLKHTKYHHLDLTHSITKWESMCSRSLTQSAYAIRSWMLFGFSIISRMSTSLRAWLDTLGLLAWTCSMRGTHNRGIFSSILAKNGVMIRPAGLEAPEQFGRVERRGEMLKKMMSKVIKDTHASGRESMDMILSECLNAANEMSRHGGFAPVQWVLSRLPRSPATMGDEDECLAVSALQAQADGPTTFGIQSRDRAKARESFVRWDCGDRVRRAALRKAAPVVGLEILSRIAQNHDKWTRIAMERRIKIDRFSRRTGTASVTRNHAHVG